MSVCLHESARKRVTATLLPSRKNSWLQELHQILFLQLSGCTRQHTSAVMFSQRGAIFLKSFLWIMTGTAIASTKVHSLQYRLRIKYNQYTIGLEFLSLLLTIFVTSKSTLQSALERRSDFWSCRMHAGRYFSSESFHSECLNVYKCRIKTRDLRPVSIIWQNRVPLSQAAKMSWCCLQSPCL